MSVAWANGVAGPADMALRLALRVREASGDRLRLTLDFSNDAEADFHHGSAHDLARHHPAFSYFAGLPGTSALTPEALEAWIAYGGGQELWDDLAAAHGLKPILAGHLGAAPRLWSTRDLRGREEWRGLRIALEGPAGEVARALGAEPISIQTSRLPSALSSGEADAVEFGGTINAMSSGITDIARYSFAPGLAPSGTAASLCVRLETWESLSRSDRAVLTACAGEAYRASVDESRLCERMILTTLEKRESLTLRALPTDIAAALPHLSEAVIAALAGHDEASRRINASYMGFRQLLAMEGRFREPIA